MKLVVGFSSKLSMQDMLTGFGTILKGAAGPATIKWLASTQRMDMKLLVGFSSKLSMQDMLTGFGIPSQRCSRSSHYKMAGLNPSTPYEIGGWIQFQAFHARYASAALSLWTSSSVGVGPSAGNINLYCVIMNVERDVHISAYNVLRLLLLCI